MKLSKKLVICWVGFIIVCLSVLPIINHYYSVPGHIHSKIMTKGEKGNLIDRKLNSFFNYRYHIDYVLRKINLFYYNNKIRNLNDNIVAGDDDFLFLNNKIGNDLIKKHRDLKFADRISIDKNIIGLSSLSNELNKKGIPFLFVLAPNKMSVYPDKLPNWFISPMTNQTSDYLISQLNKNNVMTLDLRPVLKSVANKNKEKFLYYHTDTHWNYYGASIGYSETINKINSSFKLNLKSVPYSVDDNAVEFFVGDLGWQLRISDLMKKDYDYVQDFPGKYDNLDVSEMNNANFQILKQEKQTNSFMAIRGNIIHEHNPLAINNKSIVYLRDSFGSHTSLLYAKTFTDLYHISYFDITNSNFDKFIDLIKPDLVIFQAVERNTDIEFTFIKND